MSNPVNESTFAKYKVWLIPVLAVVLLGVILYNNVGTSRPVASCDTPAAPVVEPSSVASVVAPVTTTTPAKTETVSLLTLLPPVELTSALKANPFNSRIRFEVSRTEVNNIAQADHASDVPESEVVEVTKIIPAVGQPLPAKPPVLNVTGVFRKGGRVAAIINDRIIYPGESVAEGWRLVAIDARGLVVEPDPRTFSYVVETSCPTDMTAPRLASSSDYL